MESYHTQQVIQENGTLVLREIPFSAGDVVEVIVLEKRTRGTVACYSLRGKPVRYDRPTDPVAEDEWESAS